MMKLMNSLDQPENLERVNASQWNFLQIVNVDNRCDLVNELMYDELIPKIIVQLNAIREGLHVCLLPIIKKYPDLTKEIFVLSIRESPYKYLMEACNSAVVDSDENEER